MSRGHPVHQDLRKVSWGPVLAPYYQLDCGVRAPNDCITHKCMKVTLVIEILRLTHENHRFHFLPVALEIAVQISRELQDTPTRSVRCHRSSLQPLRGLDNLRTRSWVNRVSVNPLAGQPQLWTRQFQSLSVLSWQVKKVKMAIKSFLTLYATKHKYLYFFLDWPQNGFCFQALAYLPHSTSFRHFVWFILFVKRK